MYVCSSGERGSLTVTYNAKGDTIVIAGGAQSHNGSDIRIYARCYNMLYVPEEQPRETANGSTCQAPS